MIPRIFALLVAGALLACDAALPDECVPGTVQACTITCGGVEKVTVQECQADRQYADCVCPNDLPALPQKDAGTTTSTTADAG